MINEVQDNIVWTKDILETGNSQKLLDTLIYPLGLHVPLRAGQKHRKIRGGRKCKLTGEDFFKFSFYVPLQNFSLIWGHHHCRWRAENFDLCTALMAIEQWVFFSVPHLLCHGASVYNVHLRGHSHLWLNVEQWSCHYLFLLLRSVAAGISGCDSNTRFSVG